MACFNQSLLPLRNCCSSLVGTPKPLRPAYRLANSSLSTRCSYVKKLRYLRPRHSETFHTRTASCSASLKGLAPHEVEGLTPASSQAGDSELEALRGDDRVVAGRLPTQPETLMRGYDDDDVVTIQLDDPKGASDLDYLSELIAIQQNGPKNIGFFGTRNMGFMHQQLIEILSYAMVLTGNHIFTSGATGTNAAVIRGALRAEKPDLLTVVLPQSLSKQPPESQELLQGVAKVIEMPHNDALSLQEASRMCNEDIVSRVQQVICFAFHDSNLLLETCREAKQLRRIVTLFYLD